jgi:hypothetical protein
MDPGSIKGAAEVISIAHDLICSGMLLVIVLIQVKQHNENVWRMKVLHNQLRKLQGLPPDLDV